MGRYGGAGYARTTISTDPLLAADFFSVDFIKKMRRRTILAVLPAPGAGCQAVQT